MNNLSFVPLAKEITIESAEIWLKEFYSFLKSAPTPFLSINVVNELSKDRKRSIHKPMSLSNLKKLLKELLKITDKKLLGRLDMINNAQELFNISYEAYKLLSKKQQENVCLDFVGELIAKADMHTLFFSHALGNYCDSERKITLYTSSIEESGDLFDVVYAHEAFHAYHFEYARQYGSLELYRGDYITAIILESLASFFENEYSKKSHGQNIEYRWKNSITWYPYSGAKYIKTWERFMLILKASCESMEKAIDILLEDNFHLAEFLKSLSASMKKVFPKRYAKNKAHIKRGRKSTMNTAPTTLDKRKTELEEAYEAILTDLTDGSQKSYITYLNRLFKDVLDKFAKSLQPSEISLSFIELFLRLSKEARAMLLVITNEHLKEAKKNKLYSCAKHTMDNRCSAFSRFFEVALAYEGRAVSSDKTIKPHLNTTESTIKSKYDAIGIYIYSKATLDRIYIARLRTQDRYYENIAFPMRLAMKLTANRKELRSKLESAMMDRLNHMKYIVSSDGNSSVQHGKIKHLELNVSKRVTLADKCAVYTYCNKSGDYKLQKPEISSITIDHAVSLNTLLGENPSMYPAIKKISEDMYDYLSKLGASGLTASKKATLFYDSIGKSYSDSLVDDFIEDMCNLYNQMDFVAMDKSENSSKSDTI